MLNLFESECIAVTDFFECNIIDPNHYFVKEPDVVDAMSEKNEVVFVSETILHLSNASLQELQLQVNPVVRDTNRGILLCIREKSSSRSKISNWILSSSFFSPGGFCFFCFCLFVCFLGGF